MIFKNSSEKIKGIIWDWNGTLLNDVAYSIGCINELLVKRDLDPLTEEHYKKVFTFPVKNYYETIGFDFTSEKWELVAMEYMETYWRNMHRLKLFSDAVSVLNKMREQNLKQFIVSAMEHGKLNSMIMDYNLEQYFDVVLGIDDHYGGGKAHLGNLILEQSGFSPGEVVWIGDTYHDYEVADSIGIKTVFVACGHQNREILLQSGCAVFETLSDIKLA
ncbi:HAD family hydrolase [Saccharicrinis sp. FJH2]|uniref:HAD family hydrolase n=1 Tax=Saccharicrinis sp. FJH65 TaxID=3344659 RepID=UPI0035F277B3